MYIYIYTHTHTHTHTQDPLAQHPASSTSRPDSRSDYQYTFSTFSREKDGSNGYAMSTDSHHIEPYTPMPPPRHTNSNSNSNSDSGIGLRYSDIGREGSSFGGTGVDDSSNINNYFAPNNHRYGGDKNKVDNGARYAAPSSLEDMQRLAKLEEQLALQFEELGRLSGELALEKKRGKEALVRQAEQVIMFSCICMHVCMYVSWGG